MKKKILLVAGARPNFMKIAPIMRALSQHGGFSPLLVHTGQHYDENMSDTFFQGLGIPVPDFHLEIGSGSHAEQTANIMVSFEKVCLKEKPDAVLVVGDVNSTIAAGLVAKKLNIALIHVEAGLRSGDREMPEEINRLATDAISDICFATEQEACSNLEREGHTSDCVHFVGHIMIDNLMYQLEHLDKNALPESIKDIMRRIQTPYLCMTLHRPSNVDDSATLKKLLTGIHDLARKMPVIFPCHPRTAQMIEQFGLQHLLSDPFKDSDPIEKGVLKLPPLGYNEFLALWKSSQAVLTDSGGLQEETTALGVPCLTLRKNTERPITVDMGTNILVGTDIEKMKCEVENILVGNAKESALPPLWDGKASIRIADILHDQL